MRMNAEKTPSSEQLQVRWGRFKNKRSCYAVHQAEWRVGLFWGQILWSLSGTKVEFLMKQKCSTLNLEALLMLLKACASIAMECLKFHSQRLLPSGQICNPLKPVAKIPLISRDPVLSSLFVALSIFGCPWVDCYVSLHETVCSCWYW